MPEDDDPATLDLNLLQKMERGMFTAYCNKVDGRNYQGRPIPDWKDLPPQVQEAWRAAMFYVIEEMNRIKK